MSSTIFSFFDNRNILKTALRALIALTVVFIYFQFCWYKTSSRRTNSSPISFSGVPQTGQSFSSSESSRYFFFNRNSLKTLRICSSCFSLFCCFFRKNCFKILCFCSFRILFQFRLIEKV